MKFPRLNWYLILLFNLLLVAILGTLMRYKIIAPLHGFEQRNLMQAHNIFAFNAWVSMALMLLITEIPGLKRARSDRWLLFYYAACLIQFVAFGLTGYSIYALVTLVLYLIPLGGFFIHFLKRLQNSDIKPFHRTAIRFGVFFQWLAQAGLLFLAVMMVQKGLKQQVYLGTFYFYLHFSYNGWFFFGILSVMLGFVSPPPHKTRLISMLFKAFAWLALPNFLLSILWLNDAAWIHHTAMISSLLQLMIYAYLVMLLTGALKSLKIKPVTRWMWILSGTALSIKFIFQFLSNFDLFERIAFSHRAVVIGYLHLVLLGFVTLFLIGMLIENGYWSIPKIYVSLGSGLFISGVLLNEILLMIQGLLSIQMKFIPSTNVYLFVVALMMVAGIALLMIGQNKMRN